MSLFTGKWPIFRWSEKCLSSAYLRRQWCCFVDVVKQILTLWIVKAKNTRELGNLGSNIVKCTEMLSAQVLKWSRDHIAIWIWRLTSCSNVCSSLLWHSSTHRHMGTAKHLLCVILQPQQLKTLHIFLNTVTATVEFWTCQIKICNTLKTPADQGHTFQTWTAAIHFIFADSVVDQWRRPKDGSRLVLFVTLHQYEYKNRLAACSRLFNHCW